jgi:hypothetical protein
MRTHWIIWIYKRLLALFPARYQEEYGEELCYAVRMSVEESRTKGQFEILRLAWRELRDLPAACLSAHLKERRGWIMKLTPGAHLPEGSFKYWQMAVVFLPLAIALHGVALSLSAGGGFYRLTCVIGALLLSLLVVVWVSGVVKAFPTWALPSLGLIVLVFAYGTYLISQAVTLIVLQPLWGSYWPDSIPLRLLMYLWFNLVYVAIASSILMVLLTLSPQLLQLAWKDWSLLSFLLYTLVIPYTIMNDEFQGLEPYQLASILMLIGGASLFTVLPARHTRLLALLGATLLALPTLSLGLYRIFPTQEFAAPILSFRVWEAIQPILDMPALLIILCLPVLVQRLPDSFGFKRGLKVVEGVES